MGSICLAAHKTQRLDKWVPVYESNQYDCRIYTLVSSTVGPDVEKNDLFENIPEDSYA